MEYFEILWSKMNISCTMRSACQDPSYMSRCTTDVRDKKLKIAFLAFSFVSQNFQFTVLYHLYNFGPKGLRYPSIFSIIHLLSFESTAVGQAVACAPVTQQARVRSPVGTSFLGEVFFFSEFFLTCKTSVRKLQATKVPEYHLAIIIIITHHSLWVPMT